MIILTVFFALGFLFFLVPSVAFGGEKFPVPSWMDRQPVASVMVINGLPSSVEHFTADKETEKVLQFYRLKWHGSESGEPGYREESVGPWTVISRLSGQYLQTVQVRSKGPFSTEGYLATADLNAAKERKNTAGEYPAMKGSRVINELVSKDPGQEGTTLLLVNKYSVASNSDFYRNHYLGRNWGKVIDLEKDGTCVLVFRYFGEEAHLVIGSYEGGMTSVVMNLVTN